MQPGSANVGATSAAMRRPSSSSCPGFALAIATAVTILPTGSACPARPVRLAMAPASNAMTLRRAANLPSLMSWRSALHST
jgi:hypothetical protein